MEHLIKNPELTISQIAHKCGVDYTKLRDAQLQFLRNHLKRDSDLWDEHKG